MANLPRPIAVLIENYNADVRVALKDGITLTQLIAFVGSVGETTLRTIDPNKRWVAWDAIVKVMNEKFQSGEL